jgi:anaerobic selenocysteine-containing dehydrogenase
MSTIKYRACNLCEAMCGLEIELEGDRVVGIRGDALDPFSQGHICPKATALADINLDPRRLRFPIKRDGAAWVQISWDEAFELVVSRLRDVRARFGVNAVASFVGNPAVHNSGTLLSLPAFLRALGSKNRFSATSVDQLPHSVASALMLGHPGVFPVPDLERTMHWLIMGANPLASNGSMMTAPGVRDRIKAIQARGGRVIVIDPRRTETAKLASEHHFVKPGSDVLLLLAMVQTIFAENLVRLGRLEAFSDGLAELREATTTLTPERIADRVGLPAETIRELAREFANASSAVAYGRIGLSVQRYGGLCQWLVIALNVLTGNFDRAGGAMFPSPAFDTVRSKGEFAFGRYHSRVRGLPEFNGELPVAALAEEILTPGEDQVRALVTISGNPVLSTPNGKQLEAAIQKLEFVVAIDIYLNETTRHANVILPPATGLETAHYDVAFHTLAVRNTARWNEPSIPKADGTKFDWEIMLEIANRLTLEPGQELQAPQDPAELIDAGLKAGKYKLSLEQLRANPHGMDLGELQPSLPERLQNPEKRLRLAPVQYLNDLARVETMLETPAPNGFVLIGRRELRGNNSWMHQITRLNRDQPRCTLMIHPQDATKIGVLDGEFLTVRSRVGTINVPAEITADIAPGVVCMPHGYGHIGNSQNGTDQTWDVPTEAQGSSVNDLTDDLELDDLTGNASLTGVLVQLEVTALAAD